MITTPDVLILHLARIAVSLRSENARFEAKQVLVSYFRQVYVRAGLEFEAVHVAEIEMIIDLLIEVATAEALEALARRQRVVNGRTW